ncbi:hypothetical protein MHU86_8021 [Fragilaria crotonensis]|nr:hypothetical protein MHU86_8021 [Fragilaria crotonensis]
MVVRTRRSSLQEENPPEIDPETADPDTSDHSSKTDISRRKTPNIDANQPSSNVQAQEIDTPAENPLKHLSRTVTQILSPKSVQSDTQVETSSPKTPKPSKPAAKDKQSEPAKHPTFAYPPIYQTFFTDADNSMLSWTTSVSFATSLPGHAKSLIFGPNRFLTPIPSLALQFTISVLHMFVTLARNTSSMVHQMPELQSLLSANIVPRLLQIMLNTQEKPFIQSNKVTMKLQPPI